MLARKRSGTIPSPGKLSIRTPGQEQDCVDRFYPTFQDRPVHVRRVALIQGAGPPAPHRLRSSSIDPAARLARGPEPKSLSGEVASSDKSPDLNRTPRDVEVFEWTEFA